MLKRFNFFREVIVLVSGIFICLTVSNDICYAQKRTHTLFFEGTDHELHVYRIFGKTPGKTIMLLGGIQGDEPGGFLSADLYADFSLEKGNLIVVPRANFQSIMVNRRQINHDMNRQFRADDEIDYEMKIVSQLKKLIAESDCLLNLHDGSGFYSAKWEGPDRNPNRYGQSIIADTDAFIHPENRETINLAQMAQTVCDRINQHIDNKDYYFHFNNHHTSEETSEHKEQRGSATYHALYTCHIPAFGIETSKALPLEDKVRQHNLAINAFMDMLGVVPETPGIYLDPPILNYVILTVGDSAPIVVKNHQTIKIPKGAGVFISHIESNYERGLFVDIVDYGTMNDFRKKLVISKSTQIVIKKDYYTCGKIYLELSENNMDKPSLAISSANNGSPPLLLFKVKINKKEWIFPDNAVVSVVYGDLIELVDLITGKPDNLDYTVNFKGFVGNRTKNTGEDRGYLIDTAADLWHRYSLDKKGEKYEVVVTKNEVNVGRLFFQLAQPKLEYIVLEMEDRKRFCLKPGEQLTIKNDSIFKIVDIISDNKSMNGFEVYAGINDQNKKKCSFATPITVRDLPNWRRHGEERYALMIEHYQQQLGKIYLNSDQKE